MSKQTNPAGRVDMLVERAADLFLKRFVDVHPLAERFRAIGIDPGTVGRDEIARILKREKITDVKSLRRALRR